MWTRLSSYTSLHKRTQTEQMLEQSVENNNMCCRWQREQLHKGYGDTWVGLIDILQSTGYINHNKNASDSDGSNEIFQLRICGEDRCTSRGQRLKDTLGTLTHRWERIFRSLRHRWVETFKNLRQWWEETIRWLGYRKQGKFRSLGIDGNSAFL
jgi:hypothetical protein